MTMQQTPSYMDGYGGNDMGGIPTFQVSGTDGNMAGGGTGMDAGVDGMGNGHGSGGGNAHSAPVGWSFDTFMNLAPPMHPSSSNTSPAAISITPGSAQQLYSTSSGGSMDMITGQYPFPSPSYVPSVDMDPSRQQIQLSMQGQALLPNMVQVGQSSMPSRGVLQQAEPQGGLQAQQMQMSMGIPMAQQMDIWAGSAPKDESLG
jgi:hypothetical protein